MSDAGLRILEKRADRLLQIKCTKENPRCELCNARTSECHHVVQKRQSNRLRYDFNNLVSLCRKCHTNITKEQLIDIKGKEWFDDLELKRHQICKVNKSFYQDVIKELGKEANEKTFSD